MAFSSFGAMPVPDFDNVNDSAACGSSTPYSLAARGGSATAARPKTDADAALGADARHDTFSRNGSHVSFAMPRSAGEGEGEGQPMLAPARKGGLAPKKSKEQKALEREKERQRRGEEWYQKRFGGVALSKHVLVSKVRSMCIVT